MIKAVNQLAPGDTCTTDLFVNLLRKADQFVLESLLVERSQSD